MNGSKENRLNSPLTCFEIELRISIFTKIPKIIDRLCVEIYTRKYIIFFVHPPLILGCVLLWFLILRGSRPQDYVINTDVQYIRLIPLSV